MTLDPTPDVIRIVREALSHRRLPDAITAETKLAELGEDAIDRCRIALDLEDWFALPLLDDEEIERWATVGDLAACVRGHGVVR